MNNREFFEIDDFSELEEFYNRNKVNWSRGLTLEKELSFFKENNENRYICYTNEGFMLLNKDDTALEYRVCNPIKGQITNPIKDNRIVNDMTFAVRLCGFLDDISVSDACSDDELSYLKGVATKLLTYQFQTTTKEDELDYINRIFDRFSKYMEKSVTTEDGYTFYKGDDVRLFSCMREPQKSDDSTIMFHLNSILQGGVNPNRVFFKGEANKDKYIEDNLIQYSKKDLEQLIKNK